MSLTLLVDADIVAYKFAASTEEVYCFNGRDRPPAVAADLDAAKRGAKEYLDELTERLGATSVIICLTDPAHNFRKDIWAGYKANRAGSRKPTNLTAMKEWFAGQYDTYQRPGLEADDCMGILSTHTALVRGPRIVVSEDKDLQGVPGMLFNPRTDSAPRRISKRQADVYHLWQVIVGDASDGYPGARGVGPKAPEAVAVLAAKTTREAWEHVLAAYARKPTDPGPVVQARLARILRAADWNFKEKRPFLWVPPRMPTS